MVAGVLPGADVLGPTGLDPADAAHDRPHGSTG
jgi:hypothetical protein